MKTLHIQETDDSPEILLSREENILTISGKSLPEDVSSFYFPALEWLQKYAANPLPETVMNFKFTYFNTASSKIILDILMIFEGIHENGHLVKIRWFYPEYDEDMRDAGVEYSEMVEVPFEHIRLNP